jgi:hypothetical protein
MMAGLDGRNVSLGFSSALATVSAKDEPGRSALDRTLMMAGLNGRNG